MAKQIIKIKRPKIKAPEGAVNQSLALQAMIHTEGWALMRQNMEKNIEYLEECILDKAQDGTPLNDLQVDRLRDKRGFLRELLNMPDKYADKLEMGGKAAENFDPYFSDAKDLIRSRK
ncbi:MAG: hypothetical protein ACD_5C00095G0001 [uncultured bacterium]|nr:MAG: hypothetical protein ACD_5C00095G0001 [uncultured bacterium]